MQGIVTASGRRVVFAMATEAEYGAHLRQRFAPLITGVGPVEGAVALTAALAGLKSEGHLPDYVVSLGSAGSRILEQGEVYQATHIAYRDMDASALGFEKGATPFLNLPVRLALPHRIDGVKQATLSTGANVVSGSAYDAIAEDMVDMETFAHLRAAMHFNVDLIGLRGISDGAEELRQYSGWADALPALDLHLAEAVDRLVAQL
ncbi:MAG: 5'-methylthioadenosine/S-adenosylhomocysteine nucleosidase [Phyllobacteriaceae bacterium]|nr:5'-methylthioadenosine/S-adenosylhomocysteine nucleosidase [Phyllobacteriaceae bacterium]